jgi:hypothetical protein
MSWPSLAEISAPAKIIQLKAAPCRLFLYADAQPILYKATEAQWADAFFKDGSLKIGTVWNFRKRELGTRLGDPIEGIRSYHVPGLDYDCLAGGITKDSYAFCMSKDFDKDRFAADKYDAAFQINHFGFFVEIAQALNAINPLRLFSLSPVAYASVEEVAQLHSERIRAGAGPLAAMPILANIKPRGVYEEQHEVRAVFEPEIDPNAGMYSDEEDIGTVLDLMEHTQLQSNLKDAYIKVPDAVQYATRIW